MKRMISVLLATLVMVFGLAMAAQAANDFQVGFGYEKTDNELTVEISDFGKVKLDTPGNSYFAELKYLPADWLSFSAKYNWGNADLARLDIYPAYADLDLDETTALRAEAALNWQVNDSFKLSGLVGYARYKTKLQLNAALPDDDGVISGTGNVRQKYSGAYAGVAGNYRPAENLELGAVYRYMFDPDGELSGDLTATFPEETEESFAAGDSGYFAAQAKTDMDDPSSSELELYARYAINEAWSLKAGYTQTWMEYKMVELPGVKVKNSTGGLALTAEYKF
ncbi:outer membrane protein with beta-barrel domain [Hydrogenispora ethanolica]|uniref:Outer membrane protein with beta-barrel domain n=1 Tax=Hydrogenispora ethanolica TaxID=1082276 RepID=A0A4R1RMC4_HYDET|nr:outer membrane beta-barrel protein [Hydrogenispora ethanolica]TCL67415.1 outer membrane protein with beta-barrel domain [Hydrogenispora ethanolica]